jgi:hypothetical protein
MIINLHSKFYLKINVNYRNSIIRFQRKYNLFASLGFYSIGHVGHLNLFLAGFVVIFVIDKKETT